MARQGTAAWIVVLALGGCSLGDDEHEKAPGTATKEIVAVVEELERATREGDFAAICEDLFSTNARARSGGDDCASALAQTGAGIERARLTVRAIELEKDRAVVQVSTRAADQAPVDETIVFVTEDGDYRIDALGG